MSSTLVTGWRRDTGDGSLTLATRDRARSQLISFVSCDTCTVKPVLNGHTSYNSGLYREVIFEYRSKYIAQTPLGHHDGVVVSE